MAQRNFRHGESVGGKPSPEWVVWHSMKQRCENTNSDSYERYGARGIRVCERWQVFENFLADMGRRPSVRHSIDRFPDQTGNYEPGNCRWAIAAQQNRNRSDNVFLEFSGVRKCLTDWATEVGLSRDIIAWRLKRGWSIERALSQPLRGMSG